MNQKQALKKIRDIVRRKDRDQTDVDPQVVRARRIKARYLSHVHERDEQNVKAKDRKKQQDPDQQSAEISKYEKPDEVYKDKSQLYINPNPEVTTAERMKDTKNKQPEQAFESVGSIVLRVLDEARSAAQIAHDKIRKEWEQEENPVKKRALHKKVQAAFRAVKQAAAAPKKVEPTKVEPKVQPVNVDGFDNLSRGEAQAAKAALSHPELRRFPDARQELSNHITKHGKLPTEPENLVSWVKDRAGGEKTDDWNDRGSRGGVTLAGKPNPPKRPTMSAAAFLARRNRQSNK